MSKRYPFLELGTVNAPYMEELMDSARRVIESGRYIGGAEVDAFELKLAELCDAPYAIGVSNGLDALKLIIAGYKELGRLKDGDEIIVPANTFIASALAIAHCGLTPVMADPDYDLMTMTCDSIKPFVTARTRAIMPVDLYGRVAWDDELAKMVEMNGWLVIEDAAQAIGARSPAKGLFGSYKAGALGHAGAFSFYPTKNIGALGDAGAIVTYDSQLAKTVRALANYGRTDSISYGHMGFNCRLDPMQAAFLCVKLKHTDTENADRFARAVAYDNMIDNNCVNKPIMSQHVNNCVWHQYVIKCTKRDELRDWLAENGVETAIHYAVPLHQQPCFRRFGNVRLPVAERLANEIVSLPISSCTSVRDASEISKIINRFE